MSTSTSREDVDAALRDVEDLIDCIGDEQVDTFRGEVEPTGEPVLGRVAQHGSHPYQVLGTPARNFIKVKSGFDAAQLVAAGRAQTDGGRGSVQGQQINVNQRDVENAREELVDDLSESEVREIRDEIISRLAQDDLTVDLTATGDVVTGFEVGTELFAYDQDLTVSEFSSTVSRVVNARWRTRSYMVSAYDIKGVIDSGGNPGPSAFH